MTGPSNDPWDPQPAIDALQEAFDGAATPPPGGHKPEPAALNRTAS